MAMVDNRSSTTLTSPLIREPSFSRKARARDIFQSVLRYFRTYRNWMEVLREVRGKRYPIDAVLRNGERVKLHTYAQALLLSHGRSVTYDPASDLIDFAWNGRTVHLSGAHRFTDVTINFVHEDYAFLETEGRTVLDVGANIGDSAVYFALRKAAKVIAVEPYPTLFERLKENIERNRLSGTILAVNAGVRGKAGEMVLREDDSVGSGSVLAPSAQGAKVPIVTLRDLVADHDVRDGVLKMDCEGCEYDSLLGSSDDTLRRFALLQVEYHYGYAELEKKLSKAGFKVTHSRPKSIGPSVPGEKRMEMGYIWGQRTDGDGGPQQ